jgi:hypothetical protein
LPIQNPPHLTGVLVCEKELHPPPPPPATESGLSSNVFEACNVILWFVRVQGHCLVVSCVDQKNLDTNHLLLASARVVQVSVDINYKT